MTLQTIRRRPWMFITWIRQKRRGMERCLYWEKGLYRRGRSDRNQIKMRISRYRLSRNAPVIECLLLPLSPQPTIRQSVRVPAELQKSLSPDLPLYCHQARNVLQLCLIKGRNSHWAWNRRSTQLLAAGHPRSLLPQGLRHQYSTFRLGVYRRRG